MLGKAVKGRRDCAGPCRAFPVMLLNVSPPLAPVELEAFLLPLAYLGRPSHVLHVLRWAQGALGATLRRVLHFGTGGQRLSVYSLAS